MSPDIRDSDAECSSLFPLLAVSLTKVSHFMGAQMFPNLSKVSRCARSLIQWIASEKELRAGNLLRGMLVIIFSLIAVLLSYAGLSMERSISRKLGELERQSEKQQRKDSISNEELHELPEPVQRYFRYALQKGQPTVRECKIKQTGQFRLRAGPGMRSSDNWKQVEASETFLGKEPGFVWIATIQLAPFIWLKGWDSYVEGMGNMFWKLFSAITLVSFGGPEIDRGGLARYLSETVFFPTSLLPSEKLQWEQVGVDSAKATLKHKGNTASAIFHFNEVGQVTHLQSTDRPRRLDDGSSIDDQWTGYYKDYRMSEGMHVPYRMEADWNLVSGDCRYAKLQITKHECQFDEIPSQISKPRRTSIGQRPKK